MPQRLSETILVIFLTVTACMILPCSTMAKTVASVADLKLEPGADAGSGWTVESVDRTTQFIRLRLVAGNEASGVEIVHNTQKDELFCSRAYCVQPSPGNIVFPELLRGLAERLPDKPTPGWIDGSARQLKERFTPAGGTEPGATGIFLIFLCCCLLLTGVPISLFAVKDLHWSRTRLLMLFCVAAAIFSVSHLLVRGSSDSFAILQDGTTFSLIRHLFGTGVHSSPFSAALAELLPAATGAIKLPAVIEMNRLLTMANVTLFFIISAAILDSILLALPLAWMMMRNQSVVTAAASEYPAPVITLLILTSVIFGFVIFRRRTYDRIPALISVAGLLVVTALATGFRSEFGIAGILATTCGMISVVVPRGTVESWAGHLKGWFVRGMRNPRSMILPAVLLFLFTVTMAILERVMRTPASWVAQTLNLFNSSGTDVPSFLLRFMPFAVVLLAILGAIITIRQPVVFLAIPLSTAFLLKMHAGAADDQFNHWFRLFTTDMVLVLLLSVIGLSGFRSWLASRDIHKVWRVAVPALIIGFMIIPPTSAINPGGYPPTINPTGLVQGNRNPQTEVDFLLEAVTKHSDCVFETVAIIDDEFVSVWFSADVPPCRHEFSSLSGCHLKYLSLDCNFENGPDCSELVGGAEVIEEKVFRSAPYGLTSNYDGRIHKESIRIGLFKTGGMDNGKTSYWPEITPRPYAEASRRIRP